MFCIIFSFPLFGSFDQWLIVGIRKDNIRLNKWFVVRVEIYRLLQFNCCRQKSIIIIIERIINYLIMIILILLTRKTLVKMIVHLLFRHLLATYRAGDQVDSMFTRQVLNFWRHF